MKTNESLTYSQAMQELESIVQGLERDQQHLCQCPDLEATLSQRLKRANELLAFCRGRLVEVSDKVKQTLEE